MLNKRDELEVHVAQSHPDIIAVTEVLPNGDCELTPEVEFHMKGYDLLLPKHTTRGTALYVRDSIPHRIHDLTQIEYNDHIWALIEPQAGKKILLGCVYRSPNSTPSNNQKLLDVLSEACSAPSTYLLILGDFNFKEIDWVLGIANCRVDHPASLFLDTVSENFLTQHVNQPTRYREQQTPSLLDLVIIDKEDIIENLEYEAPLGKSDHIVIRMNLLIAPQDTTKQQHYNFNKGDYEAMREELGSIDWDSLLQDKPVDDTWQSLEDINKLSRGY